MPGTNSKTPVIAPTADAYRAFADFLSSGPAAGTVGADGNFTDWWASEGGQTAAAAFQDQANAELRSLRMSWARAVARDFKVNGKLTTYSRDRAISLAAYLATVDFDSVPEPEVATADASTDSDAS